jgi:hypothetical protein
MAVGPCRHGRAGSGEAYSPSIDVDPRIESKDGWVFAARRDKYERERIAGDALSTSADVDSLQTVQFQAE